MGGLNYKVVKKTFGFGKDGTEKYVAEAVRGGTVSFEKVIEQISLRSGISKATCRAVVETMVESACTWMLEGHGVSLGNMGYLKPAITCKSSEVSGEEKIIRKRVLFQPSKDFKAHIDKMSLNRMYEEGNGTPGTTEPGEEGEDQGGGGFN